MTDVVLFKELPCGSDNHDQSKKIGLITLNSPRSLNALSGEMIDLIYPQLVTWKNQNNIVAVLIEGAGEKAFCAGGDIVHMYKAMQKAAQMPKNEGVAQSSPELKSYFTKEYQLDYFIHTFEKPFIVWGSGIVMGGGLGLMVGGSHRIVTQTSRIAMPEISIGLYPDVGASYFLNKMPKGLGLFLGLTGASINAIDAKYCSLADHFVESSLKESFISALSQLNYKDTVAYNHNEITQLLNQFEQKSEAFLASNPIDSQLSKHNALINSVTDFDNLSDIVNTIINTQTSDVWFTKAQKSLQRGSALSAQITYKQLKIGQSLSLEQCFDMELGLSIKCGQFGEFVEGVRALLIDKDYSPNWRFENVESVDEAVIDWFFEK